MSGIYNHENGVLIKINGYLFFQGFIIDTTSKNLDIKKGSTINYRIYYPNPPDCISSIYIKNDDGSTYDVFKKSSFLNFLQTTYQDNSTIGTYKINIMLEQKYPIILSLRKEVPVEHLFDRGCHTR